MSKGKKSPGFSQSISRFFQHIQSWFRALFARCSDFFSSLFSRGRKQSSASRPVSSSSAAKSGAQKPEDGATIVFNSKELKQASQKSRASGSKASGQKAAPASLFCPRKKKPTKGKGTNYIYVRLTWESPSCFQNRSILSRMTGLQPWKQRSQDFEIR